jgi:Tfp pilus assembly protein PilX
MQPNTWSGGTPGRQRGIALFIGLVFLVMLTLVSLVVMRGTLVEMRMTTATSRHEQLFEASETARRVPEAMLSLLVVILYMAVTCPTRTASYNFEPSTWDPSIIFTVCDPVGSTCSSANQTTDKIAIVRDGVSLNQGSGAAQAQGYSSVGVGTAKGGSALLLQIRSFAAPTPTSTQGATTIAQYKVNITN